MKSVQRKRERRGKRKGKKERRGKRKGKETK
jgi:hypothetical protein